MNWWQNLPSHIDPVFFSLGSFQIRYYGLMYVAAFTTVYLLIKYRLKHEAYSYTLETIQSFMVWAILGVLIGGRLGYILFYDLSYFISNPLKMIMPVEFSNGFRFTGISGMSFHGGVLGVFFASLWFCHREKINFFHLGSLILPAIPLGYTFGRIGNFLNGELYGRTTTVPWGMYFPLDVTHQLRHPSQLYEAFFEGIVLFIVLWSLRNNLYIHKYLLALFLIGYGVFRFFIEYVREPDAHLGLIALNLSMGQLLCLGMIISGVALIILQKYIIKNNNS